MSNNYKLRKKLLSTPGDTLQETIDALGMNQYELAERLGKNIKNVNQIIKGREAITIDTAISLEKVTGVPADFWIERECLYRKDLAVIEQEKRIAKYKDWAINFPIPKMLEFKWIPKASSIADKVDGLLQFFGIANPKQWYSIYEGQKAATAFRISLKNSSNPYSISAWLRQGEIQARELKLKKFNKSKFRKSLNGIREITNEPSENFFKDLQAICGECGVAVVHTPNIPKAAISGSFRWIQNRKIPLIQLSGRYRTNDHFWFTFFHEAGHLLLHGKKDIFLEEAEGIKGNGKKEEEADRFARNILINEKAYSEFVNKGIFTKESITEFSRTNKVNAGIVAGRLQHDGYVGQAVCNEFKTRIRF